jgi:predicted nuclease of restriction endonuclease-like (RecB) superfamily
MAQLMATFAALATCQLASVWYLITATSQEKEKMPWGQLSKDEKVTRENPLLAATVDVFGGC